MKSKRKINPKAIMIVLLLAFIIHQSSLINASALPEPSSTIFGKVYNTNMGNTGQISSGKIVWTMEGETSGQNGNESLVFETEIECTDCITYTNGVCTECNDYGYRLSMPQETIPAGMTASDGVAQLTDVLQQYDFQEVTVDGLPAVLRLKSQFGNTASNEPQGNYVLLGQQRRLHFYEIDLEIVKSLDDKDKDGMPDYWEVQHGLNEKYPADAELDPDGDGWDNLEEFLLDTDPNAANTTPSLAGISVKAFEGAKTGVHLQPLDADSCAWDISYTLLTAPSGGTLYLAGEGTSGMELTPLEAESEFRLAGLSAECDLTTDIEIEPGECELVDENERTPGCRLMPIWLVYDHADVSVTSTSFFIRMKDESGNSATHFIDIEIMTPSKTDGTDAAVWLDAFYQHSANPGMTVGTNDKIRVWLNEDEEGEEEENIPADTILFAWQDRSGPKYFDEKTDPATGINLLAPFDALAWKVNDIWKQPLLEPDMLEGKPAIALGQSYPIFQMPYQSEVNAFPKSDRTIFAMLKPEGTDRQVIFSCNSFEIAVEGQNDANAGSVSYGSNNRMIYGKTSVANQWSLVTVSDRDEKSRLEINNIWDGGPFYEEKPSDFSTDPVVGSRITYPYDADADDWIGQEIDSFQGRIAELLVFNQYLPPEKRHMEIIKPKPTLC
ncbi:MAG: hypothetical protein GY795_01400 [Desulfobacterales bacterium]|nr:hypothetical protein [Desulfobacterales bacterium]